MKQSFVKRMTALMTAAAMSALMTANVTALDNSIESFSPSVDSGSFTDDSGNTGNVLITTEDGATYIPPADDYKLEVTDLSEVSDAKLEEIKAMLEEAEAQVAAVDNNAAELTSEVEEVIAIFNEMTPETPDVKPEDMVVVDVFDVSLVHLVEGEDESVVGVPDSVKATFEVTFPFSLPSFYLLLHEPTPGTWVVERNVETVDDHTLRCTVNDGFSPFALIVDSSGSQEISSTEQSGSEQSGSEQSGNYSQEDIAAGTGENGEYDLMNIIADNRAVMIIPAAAAAAAAAAVIIARRRRKTADR